MKLAVVALHALVAACAIVLSGSGLSSHPPSSSGSPPAPASTDAITTDLSDYLWPTDAGNIVTSTFAEFRAMHFHGGVDVSTGDVIGYRVYAMRDGYVSRIRIFPTGYGKMLYVRHRDGYSSTYAHLSRFAPAVEALARAEQLRRQCYPVDIELSPGEVPVAKGAVIAYTGHTGIGTPHLHFEIRDQNLEPINPQLCAGLLAPDGIPPTIQKIAMVPLGEHSLVHGGWDTQVYTAHATSTARYRIRETITVSGRAGFAICARDRTEGSRFQRGVYRYVLSIDGRPFSTTTLNRAPMREAHAIGLHYAWDLLDRGLGRFERLYPDVPGALPFYGPNGSSSGIIGSGILADGPHEFVIAAEDIAGNRAEVAGTFVVARAPEFSLETSGADLRLRFPDPQGLQRVVVSTRRLGGSWSDPAPAARLSGDLHSVILPLPPGGYDMIRVSAEDAWGNRSHPGFLFVRKPSGSASLSLSHTVESDFVRVVARTSGMFTAPPTVVVYEGSRRQVVPMTPSDADLYVGTFRPSPALGGLRRVAVDAEIDGKPMSAFEEMELYPVLPGQRGSYVFDGGRLVVRFDSLSAYRELLLQVEKHTEDDATFYSLLPAEAVLRDGIEVSVSGGPPAPKVGLYFHGRNSRELLSAQSREGVFTGRVTRTLGDVALMADDAPPSLSRLFVRADRTRRLDLSFRTSDNLSGVEYEAMKMYIDGTVVIPEVDGEHHRVFYRSDEPLERGSHRLLIRLADKAGNSGTTERRFAVR